MTRDSVLGSLMDAPIVRCARQLGPLNRSCFYGVHTTISIWSHRLAMRACKRCASVRLPSPTTSASAPRRRSGGGPCLRNCSARHNSRAGWRASTAAAPVDLDSLIPFASMASGKCAYSGAAGPMPLARAIWRAVLLRRSAPRTTCGDALGGIVDDDRQLIGKQAVATADDEVTRIARQRSDVCNPCSRSVERDRAGRDAEADRERPVRRRTPLRHQPG